MRQGHWRSLRLTVAFLVAAGALSVTTPAALSACAGPGFTSKNDFRPGATAVIRGTYFAVGCDDTGSQVMVGGCTITRDQPTGPQHPTQNVRITLSQHGKTYLLGIRDANQNYKIRLKTTLPKQLDPGTATLRAQGDGGATAKEKVVIKHPSPSH